MALGYLSVVLHAHLPYVRHPEHERFLEEDWFYEALSETYIPLLHVFEGLAADRVPFRLTMSMTPTLLGMLSDPMLCERYVQHLDRLIELAKKEIHRTRDEPEFCSLARMYLNHFKECRHTFVDRYQHNLIQGFRKLQDDGFLEIITCGATHGFLPLMQTRPQAVWAQIELACDDYSRHFARRPRGIWLPECGYYPGVDEMLNRAGIRFCMVDAHGVLFAEPRPKMGTFAPIYTPNKVAVFGRDIESSKQVWSAEEGYPGDYNYREFYRDVGFDLPLDYVRPYIYPGDLRVNTGIKYFAITGRTAHKRAYRRDVALDTAAAHAGNFLFNRVKQVEYLHGLLGQAPIVLSPYDAELFGHWWFEGPQFLDFLFRKMHFEQDTIEPITPIEYLNRHPRHQVATPTYSSWGHNGYAEVWLENSNDWIYRHLDQAAGKMTQLASNHSEASGVQERVLNQAARELLLAQSSDWAFIMKTQTMVPYAVKRTKEHVHRFARLAAMLDDDNIDEGELISIESKDNVFPELNFRIYAQA